VNGKLSDLDSFLNRIWVQIKKNLIIWITDAATRSILVIYILLIVFFIQINTVMSVALLYKKETLSIFKGSKSQGPKGINPWAKALVTEICAVWSEDRIRNTRPSTGVVSFTVDPPVTSVACWNAPSFARYLPDDLWATAVSSY
jgi:hypothetical protein